jgi:hypothetical protein
MTDCEKGDIGETTRMGFGGTTARDGKMPVAVQERTPSGRPFKELGTLSLSYLLTTSNSLKTPPLLPKRKSCYTGFLQASERMYYSKSVDSSDIPFPFIKNECVSRTYWHLFSEDRTFHT